MNVPGVSGARMNTFQGGTIYWSPSTGAHVVYGGIGALYNSLGGPTSYLGLPTSDEQGLPASRFTYFQNGKIVWTPQGGANAIPATTQMTFGSDITLGGGVPVGGWANLTVSADGSYHFTGHLHDSGFASYNDSVMVGLVSPSGILYTIPPHTGHMAGTIESGSRDDNWDITGNDPVLANAWADLEGCRAYFATHAGSDWNPLVGQIEQAAGIVLSVVGIVVGGSGNSNGGGNHTGTGGTST
jgi:uncharacterized protein with LGFP repeats